MVMRAPPPGGGEREFRGWGDDEPSAWSSGFWAGLRWLVIPAFVVAALAVTVVTAYQWGREDSSPSSRTASSYPDARAVEARRQMLELINAERARAGLDPLVPGRNPAAQLHAEASLEACILSHWGSDGLKPYMRYSLAGGHQYNSENVSGRSYCVTAGDGYLPGPSIEREISEAMAGLMASPGHRANVLDGWHRKVNIGLAWDRYNFVVVQHFEADYAEYVRLPAIQDGVLTLAGLVKNGVAFRSGEDLGVEIVYDPPPQSLRRGQLSRTYCYSGGTVVAAIRPPAGEGRYYLEDEIADSYEAESCPDPYDIPENASSPRTPEEADKHFRRARELSRAVVDLEVRAPWVTATEWTVDDGGFAVAADLSDILAEHGRGVYTVVVWGLAGGEEVIITQYSIFHGLVPPGGDGAVGR